jgi:hypothetical protein
MKPRLDPRLLNEHDSVIATNARIDNGFLRGWQQPSTISTLAGGGTKKTIYNFGTHASPNWLSWTTDVDVARSPILGNLDNRTYTTGDSYPKTLNNTLVGASASYQLGVPPPTTAPTVANRALADKGTVTGNITTATGRMQITTTTGFTISSHSDHVFELSTAGTTTQLLYFSGFKVGLTLKVASIVDADNFTITSGDGSDYICSGDAFAGWHVAPYATVPLQILAGNVLLPNGVQVNLTGHGLRVDDILTLTDVSTVPSFSMGRGRITPVVTGSLTQTPTDFIPMDAASADLSITAPGHWSFTVSRNQAYVSTREYVYTWVTNLDEESAPSLPSALVDTLDGDSVTISAFDTAPSTNRVVSSINLYRTLTGTAGTDYQFVANFPVATTTYTESMKDAALGAILPSDTWDPPPSDLFALTTSPNGFLVGASGNQVCFCEPGYPHAWPFDYRLQTDYPIVGIGLTGATTFVLTQGQPYAIFGSDPRNMTMRRIEASEACVSKRSIVAWSGAVFYAGPNGLMKATDTSLINVTAGLFTREQWQSTLIPSSIVGSIYQGLYVGFYTDGVSNSGTFIMDPNMPETGILKFDTVFNGAFTDRSTGDMYLTDGTNLLLWNGGADSTVTWRSKIFVNEAPLNMGAARVVATAYPVTFNLYDGSTGTLIATRTIANSEPVRLPAGKLYDQLQMEVVSSSSITVRSVAAAESMYELSDT